MPYPYSPRTWLEGEKGVAADLNKIELAIAFAATMTNVKEAPYSAKGDGVANDAAAINAAIASLPTGSGLGLNGGALYFPAGAYKHLSEVTAKKLTNVRCLGGGGLSGGGAIGIGASVAATVVIYEGAGARAWDFREAVGCCMENMACLARGEGFAGYIWDFEGGANNHFVNATAECGRTLGGTKEIVAASGVNLANTSGNRFDVCIFSSCLYGVVGRNSNAVESVSQVFHTCQFIGSQAKHVANPDDAWAFYACIAEGLYNRKGEAKKEAGFIGFTSAEIKARGVTLSECWSSSNEAATRGGINVEYRGKRLKVDGGEYACCETAFYFPEGPRASRIKTVGMVKLNNGIVWLGKLIDCDFTCNEYTEVTLPVNEPAAKERKGSMLQTANEAAIAVS